LFFLLCKKSSTLSKSTMIIFSLFSCTDMIFVYKKYQMTKCFFLNFFLHASSIICNEKKTIKKRGGIQENLEIWKSGNPGIQKSKNSVIWESGIRESKNSVIWKSGNLGIRNPEIKEFGNLRSRNPRIQDSGNPGIQEPRNPGNPGNPQTSITPS